MTIEQLTEAVGEGFIPQDPAQLHAMMEGLPGFFEKLGAALHEFSEFLGGTVGDETSAHVGDAATAAQNAQEDAAEAFVAYQREADSWVAS